MKNLLVIFAALLLSMFAFAQDRTQPCKEAAKAVALGTMFEKFGERMTEFSAAEAYEQIAPNGREYYVVSFGKWESQENGFKILKNTTVLVTTWDPEKKTGSRCAITDVFGPTTERDPAGPRYEILPDDPR